MTGNTRREEAITEACVDEIAKWMSVADAMTKRLKTANRNNRILSAMIVLQILVNTLLVAL